MEKIMDVILVDDEPLARKLIRGFLQSDSRFALVAECGDGFDAIKAIKQHKPDLIFLDVQMPRLNGFEVLELLDEPPPIIFTTAFDEYAIKAFEAGAIDYLLKPISPERFDKAIQRLFSQSTSSKIAAPALNANWSGTQRIVVKNGADVRIIPLNELMYIESMDDYVKLHTEKERHLKKQPLQQFEDQLQSSGFVRIHRTILLNTSYLQKIEPMGKDQYVALLRNGQQLPISRQGYQRLKLSLGV
jgi:two-component system LytT family response regulator